MADLSLPSLGGACPCCGSHERAREIVSPDRFFNRPDEYVYAVCGDCGAAFLLPSDGWSIDKAYPRDYEFFHEAPALGLRHRIFAWYLFPQVPRKVRGKVVDMGTSTGLFTALLAARGHDVLGVEMDADAVRLAQAAGRPVVQGDWESTDFEDGSLGVLVMNQVIEHLLMPPDDVFGKVRRILEPGGRWIFRTPNAAGWGLPHYGSCWHPLEVPRHTVVYTPDAVRRLAAKHGFTVEKLFFAGRHNDILQSEKYLARDQASRLGSRLFRLPVVGGLAARGWASLQNLRGFGDILEAHLVKRS